jgi:hypothetical protein
MFVTSLTFPIKMLKLHKYLCGLGSLDLIPRESMKKLQTTILYSVQDIFHCNCVRANGIVIFYFGTKRHNNKGITCFIVFRYEALWVDISKSITQSSNLWYGTCICLAVPQFFPYQKQERQNFVQFKSVVI